MAHNLQSDDPSTQLSFPKKLPSQVEPERVLYHLSRSPLLAKYLRGVIIDEILTTWQQSPEFQSIVRTVDPNILNKNRQAIILQLYKRAQFSRFVRSRFLAQKSQLDRVLFSIIQVKNLQLAQELYFRIEDRKQSFTKLASIYSDSPTAKRGGTIGPILFHQLSSPIQYYLTGLQPQQLSQIFQLDEHYLFLQLDRSLPVQFTPQIEQQLLDELFDEWLQPKILERVGKASVKISSPVIEFPQRVNSKIEDLAISQDLATDDRAIGTIAPTSSFFFPIISPTGKILSPNTSESQQVNSSFFPPPEVPIKSSNTSSHNPLLIHTIAFGLFFCLFLVGGTLGIKSFRQPPMRSKSVLGEIHKLPLRLISNVVKVEESRICLGGNGGGWVPDRRL